MPQVELATAVPRPSWWQLVVVHAPNGAPYGIATVPLYTRPVMFARFTDPLYFGGPVERVGLFAVFRAGAAPGQSFRVVDDVHLALHPATVEQLLLKPPEQVRFFNGYAGWAPGQLAAELQRGDWWVFEADPETAFRKDTATLWEELARRAQSITALR